MSLPARKNLFFGLFSVLLLLSFLLSETYLSLYVLGLFSALLLLFRNTFAVKKTVDSTVVTLAMLFLAVCGLSLLGSVSLPLSLYSLTRYVFLFVFFLFFLKTDFSQEEKNIFFHLLLFQGISLVFVSALFFFLPEYGYKIPGMNLIFATYGHNHLGAIMLLLNPIAFWLYLTEKKNFYFFLFVLFSAALMISFGRVVIFIGLIQTIFLGLLYKKWKNLSFKSPLGLFMAGMCAVFIVSLFLYVQAGIAGSCLVDIEDAAYREQICKTDLRKNVRNFYWQQAWEGLLARPMFGYGIGTFSAISYQHRQLPEFRSSYAHNDYLQLFAEGGIGAGVLFVVLMGFLYWGSWRSLRGSSQLVIFTSLAAIGIDIFFDFDFHFFGVALLIFLLFALIFESPRPTHSQLPLARLQPGITFALVSLLLVSGLYITVDRLIVAEKEDIAYRIFPFFHWHSLNFMKSDKLSFEQKTFLAKTYWASPTTQIHQLDDLKGDQKAELEYQSWHGDPWRRITSYLPQYYLEKKDAVTLEKVLVDIRDFLTEKRTRFGYQRESIPYLYKAQWAKGFLFLAEQKFAEKKYTQASQFFQDANYFDEWSTAQPHLMFDQALEQGYEPAMKDFLTPLTSIPVEYFGDNRDSLAKLYFEQSLFLLALSENNELIVQSVQQAIAVAPWNIGWFMTGQFSQTLQRYVDIQLERGNNEQVSQLLDTITQNAGDFYWLRAQRGYFYGMVGDNEKAKTAFEECLIVNPDHEDCRHGLQNLVEKGYPDLQRYYEIREILLAW